MGFWDYGEFVFEWLPMYNSIKKEIIRIGGFKTAVEFGCSIGGSARFIADVCGKTWGVDAGRDRIGIAAKRFKNIEFIQCDCRCTPFKNRQFDAVYLIMMLHEAPCEEIVREACRIGERIIVIDYNYPVTGGMSYFIKFVEGKKLERFQEFNIVEKFQHRGYSLKEESTFHPNLKRWLFEQVKP